MFGVCCPYENLFTAFSGPEIDRFGQVDMAPAPGLSDVCREVLAEITITGLARAGSRRMKRSTSSPDASGIAMSVKRRQAIVDQGSHGRAVEELTA
jgi:hypothetical protein